MSEFSQDELDHGPEGLPSSVRLYTYQGKDDFAQVLDLERERLYHSMHHPSLHFIAKTTSNGLYRDGLTSYTSAEEAGDVTEYLIFSIDTSAYVRA